MRGSRMREKTEEEVRKRGRKQKIKGRGSGRMKR